jgi:hypothetical protein
MPIADRSEYVSIFEALEEIRGLTSKDGRQSSLARRRKYPKTKTPRISHHQNKAARNQYSQTGTLGKAEGDIHRKKIICCKLDWRAEDEYDLKGLHAVP